MKKYAHSPVANEMKPAASNPTTRPLQDNRPASVATQQQASALSATLQKKANNTGLPDQLKSGIESLSGHSMDDVKVHYNSAQPAQIQAHAYAQGSQIHLAPGQEKHLPHEAWHVVQQKQGRVKATKQLKGKLGLNDDSRLEQEADNMGLKALRYHAATPANGMQPLQEAKAPDTGQPVAQRVGGEKMGFQRSDDFGLWRGQLVLDTALEEMQRKRGQRKEGIWTTIDNKIKTNEKNKASNDNISTEYSAPLEALQDEEQQLRLTQPFTSGILSIVGNKVMYQIPATNPGRQGLVELATIVKGDKAFKLVEVQPREAKRQVYQKHDDTEYVKDSRHVMTRRYAYVEKSYWQFMEFVHTHHMEGRYQKLLRAAGVVPDVRNNDNEMVKKAQRKKGKVLTLEQLAFVHQYWGSGSQQRGLSLSSTKKPGVTIGNTGENFRTNNGFRIKIDLARIPNDNKAPLLLNHYSHKGVKDSIQDQGGDVENNPLSKSTPYKYQSSVIKNRELYLEHLKPEWIVSVEHHPSAKDNPGVGQSTVYDLSDYNTTGEFMAALKEHTGGSVYGLGFEMALKDLTLPKGSDANLKNGFSSGCKYLEGYKTGQEEKVQEGRKRATRGFGTLKKNTKNDWSDSRNKKKQQEEENDEKMRMYVANLTLENIEHAKLTDVYRIGYIHGWLGEDKLTKISDLR